MAREDLITRTFESLKQQIRAGQNVAISGIHCECGLRCPQTTPPPPWRLIVCACRLWVCCLLVAGWTTDIGGYSGGNPDDPVMKQLLIRWFQFGAFCPLFRLHGDRSPELINECGRTGSPDEVWHYGDEALKSITTIMHLRESIRPCEYE